MFSDLKKGFQVHTLDTNTVPKYELGKGSSRIRTQVSSSSAGSVSGDADPRGGSDGRAHWRNQDLYGSGIPECG